MKPLPDMDSVSHGFRSESPTFEYPLTTPIPLFSSQRNRTKILSPSARRVAHSQLEKLLELEALKEPDSPLPVVEKSPFRSDMPIGSLVHFQGPQEWGVVKIANVSIYTILCFYGTRHWTNAYTTNIDPILHYQAGNCTIPWPSGSSDSQRSRLCCPYHHGTLDSQDHGLLR